MDDLSKYYFLPIKDINEIISKMKMKKPRDYYVTCTKSLLDLRRKRNLLPVNKRQIYVDWKLGFTNAIRRSIIAHDWDKLQTLLSKAPIWEIAMPWEKHNADNYFRALLILLMYHPSAKAQNLLNKYIHMVLGGRTDQDKIAITKILVAIPDKYPNRGKKEML